VGEPLTVTCPGCGHGIEVEHQQHTTLNGHVIYARTQTDHEALLDHVDACPNVTKDNP
jgi:hypothetical protein